MDKSFGKKRKSTDSVATEEATPMKKAFNTSIRKSIGTPKGKMQTPAKQQNGNATPSMHMAWPTRYSLLQLQFAFYLYSF